MGKYKLRTALTPLTPLSQLWERGEPGLLSPAYAEEQGSKGDFTHAPLHPCSPAQMGREVGEGAGSRLI
jgi:hypothetical protein